MLLSVSAKQVSRKGYFHVSTTLSESNYSDLEANYATLKKENAAQQAEIAELKARKPEIVKEETIIDNSEIRLFRVQLLSHSTATKIELSQEVSIFNIAEFKSKSEIRVRLTGYADKRGSNFTNRIVSRKTCQCVTKCLSTNTGIKTVSLQSSKVPALSLKMMTGTAQ